MPGPLARMTGLRLRPRKAPNAFRTISEVADDLHIPQHVLRFWETKFPQVRPLKRGGGRRYYRPDDIVLLRRIADLLYTQGYTIKGVQRLLREGGGQLSDDIPPPTADERAAADAEKSGLSRGAADDPWPGSGSTTARARATGHETRPGRNRMPKMSSSRPCCWRFCRNWRRCVRGWDEGAERGGSSGSSPGARWRILSACGQSRK